MNNWLHNKLARIIANDKRLQTVTKCMLITVWDYYNIETIHILVITSSLNYHCLVTQLLQFPSITTAQLLNYYSFPQLLTQVHFWTKRSQPSTSGNGEGIPPPTGAP